MAAISSHARRWCIAAMILAVVSARNRAEVAHGQIAKPVSFRYGVDIGANELLAADDASPQQRRGRGFGPQGLYKAHIQPNWFADNNGFWYCNNLPENKKEFIVVHVENGTRQPAFDHAKLASSLSEAAQREYSANCLPFNRIEFVDDDTLLRFVIDQTQWECNLDTYECKNLGDGRAERDQNQSDGRNSRFRGRRFGRRGADGRRAGRGGRSPDGKREALVRDGNVFVRAADNSEKNGDKQESDEKELKSDKGRDEFQLTDDGTEHIAYGLLQWAPDSESLVAFRIEPGDHKEVYLFESSPPGGGRANMRSRPYDLPGDKLTSYELSVFDIAHRNQIKPQVDKIDLGFPHLRWDADGRDFVYEKVDRGHQRFRVIRVDTHTGGTREIIDEKSDTFIWTAHTENLDLELVNWLPNSEEIIYVSERDGWRHLYLIDAETGEIKNQITKGEYVIRGIDRIDEEKRQIWFHASGKNTDQDPYFLHYYRVNFDGSDVTALTDGNGNHSVQFSPDRKYLIDTYSRVDMPPKHELRKASDGKFVCAFEEANASVLMNRDDYRPLESFVAKGRDGKTDIWGVICRPKDFDPAKKYPVIESIYAGPQGSFVPKSFGDNRYASLADLGFIVVQIDGMGTANRSKAFHDVCWHNLKDAGFPDRILWMKAAAEEYPYLDLSRVGIYGGSAGGQNAAAGVLFHPEFYKAAVAGCGCHDNRMDKASWNEQWMGYPVGPQYSECSNIDNASSLQGNLMLILGELDDNVPVESTFRFADALIKANKDFDLVVVPGAGHGMGGEYGIRRMQDFFVRHLLGTAPSNRNAPTSDVIAESNSSDRVEAGVGDVLDLTTISQASRVDKIAERFLADRANLLRYYAIDQSPKTSTRWKKFYTAWLEALRELPAYSSDEGERARMVGLRRDVANSLARIEQQTQRRARIESLVPFASAIEELAESRRLVKKVDSEVAAAVVDKLSRSISMKSDELAATLKDSTGDDSALAPENLEYAAEEVEQLRSALRNWFQFYDGYDPQFSWWLHAPYRQTDEALAKYAAVLYGTPSEAEASPPRRSASSVGNNGEAENISESNHDDDVPDLEALIDATPSRMEPIVAMFSGEFSGEGSRWGNPDRFRNPDRREFEDDAEPARRRRNSFRPRRRRAASPEQRAETQAAYNRWLAALDKLDFDSFSPSDRVDYLLLKNHINYRLKKSQDTRLGDDSRDLPVTSDRPILGRPIGRDALLVELGHEMIPYTPEQLLKIAERENAWCEVELVKAADEMGFGDDWRAAVEKVKRMHVQPGQQPYLIYDLANEAIEYLKANDLVTVPSLAEETWGLRMMSPRRQLINPFFTGGNEISVSYPTDTMSHEEKLQSMRGNNIPFARATVHHELIPGHNLQFYMTARYHTYRRMFSTPFWGEGWALYWEMLLYERGFPKTPEDRVGFLTWRKHRCARIVFSLSYHLGRMTPAECIDYLVANVGFDRHNATAEVRRSFEAAAPLYQAAYMLGGLQIRDLRHELVDSGKMSNREFHDAILKEGSMPIVMVRALLTGEKLTKDYKPDWQFYGPVDVEDRVAGAEAG